MAYQLAALAGLRFSEVKALAWGDIDLGSSPATITIRPANAKSRFLGLTLLLECPFLRVLVRHVAVQVHLGKAGLALRYDELCRLREESERHYDEVQTLKAEIAELQEKLRAADWSEL